MDAESKIWRFLLQAFMLLVKVISRVMSSIKQQTFLYCVLYMKFKYENESFVKYQSLPMRSEINVKVILIDVIHRHVGTRVYWNIMILPWRSVVYFQWKEMSYLVSSFWPWSEFWIFWITELQLYYNFLDSDYN